MASMASSSGGSPAAAVRGSTGNTVVSPADLVRLGRSAFLKRSIEPWRLFVATFARQWEQQHVQGVAIASGESAEQPIPTESITKGTHYYHCTLMARHLKPIGATLQQTSLQCCTLVCFMQSWSCVRTHRDLTRWLQRRRPATTARSCWRYIAGRWQQPVQSCSQECQ